MCVSKYASKIVPGTARARVAAFPQRVGDRHAYRVARGKHRGREARAFLVGPHDDLDRLASFNVRIIECAHHLQRGEHAVYGIEAAALELCFESADARLSIKQTILQTSVVTIPPQYPRLGPREL
ncbi:hypothetical protein SAMN05446635_5420 [Burkholderia sp. OK233]|nr:hypothetical protein SAMN05446635_5420 [Burkholderia sp. OK233]